MIRSTRGYLAVGLLLSSLLLSGVALGQPSSAAGWIEQASSARAQQSFIAEFVYQHADTMESMRIWHSVDANGDVHERLLSLSGQPREILRNGDSVTCLLPGIDSHLISERRLRRSITARMPADVARLQPHYRVEQVGDDRVAGRTTTRVAIQADDALRYSYHLWFDHQTGLLMRAEVLDPSARVIERLMVLSMELVDQIEPSLLEPALSTANFQRVTSSEAPIQSAEPLERDWQASELPAGFVLQMNQMQALPGRPHAVRHLLYSDGLATVSVYVEPGEQTETIEGALQMGAMNAYGRAIDGYQVIVVGEVPAPTVQRIAEGLSPASR